MAVYLALARINKGVRSELEWLFKKIRKKEKVNVVPASLFLSLFLGIGAFITSLEMSPEIQNKESDSNFSDKSLATEAKEEPEPLEISKAPEAVLTDEEIAAAMDSILSDTLAEKRVLAASWEAYPTGARVLVAEVADDGTKQNGFAEYLCHGVRAASIPLASVSIVRDLSLGPLEFNNILGSKLCAE